MGVVALGRLGSTYLTLTAAELVPVVAVRVVAAVPVVRRVIVGAVQVAAALSAEASRVGVAQAHVAGDVCHHEKWRGAWRRTGGVHGSGAVDGAQLGKEWVVRPERTTADGIREVTTAVGGAEGRRHREAWHPDRLLPPLDREPVDGRDLDGGARGLQASPVARAEHPRGVRSEYGAGLAVATEAGRGAALGAPITL